MKARLTTMVLVAGLVAGSNAAALYWDANGEAEGAGEGSPAIWGVDACWSEDRYGAVPTSGYSALADVYFAACGDAWWSDIGSYQVLLSGAQEVNALRFFHGTPTLEGGILKKESPLVGVVWQGQTVTINSAITNASESPNGVTKFGWGNLVLGGTNTYRGPTTIEGGILRMGAPFCLPPATDLVLANGDTRPEDGFADTTAVLEINGCSQVLGLLRLEGPNPELARVIDFGSQPGTLAFAGSAGVDWQGLTLSIAGFRSDVHSLRFGQNSNGLTPAQLASLRFVEYLDVPGKIDAQGYVQPILPQVVSLVPEAAGQWRIVWTAVPGRKYLVQYKEALSDAAWLEAGLVVTAESNTASFVDDAQPGTVRFYRVQLQPIQPWL